MQKVVFSILVDNTSGVLSRIAGLFSRRGYNIDSLTVGVTADPRYSRATVVTKGDQQILDQIEKQLNKLEDVVDIKRLDPDNSVCRELLLVKVLCDEKNRQNIISIADIFRAKIVDVSIQSLVIELVGSQSKLSAFLRMLKDVEILELARTGLTGLSRGTFDVKIYDENGELVDYDFMQDYSKHTKGWRKRKWQRFTIRKIVILQLWKARQSQLSVTAARVTHRH